MRYFPRYACVLSFLLTPMLSFASQATPHTPATVERGIFRTRHTTTFAPLSDRTKGAEILLVLFPGANKGPAEYETLAAQIQAASPAKIWVSIVGFTANVPNGAEAGKRIDEALAQVKNQNGSDIPAARVFVAGHSLGGIVAQGRAKSLGGLILLSSFLSSDLGMNNRITDYPAPVLTLAGELDGLTRITRIAADYETVMGLYHRSGSDTVLYKKPVVVLPGVNHSQMSGPQKMNGDLDPEISYEEAQKAIAQVVSEFVTANTSTEKEAQEAIKKRTLATAQLFESWYQAQEMEITACAKVQPYLAGLTEEDSRLGSFQHDKIQFENSKLSDKKGFKNNAPDILVSDISTYLVRSVQMSTPHARIGDMTASPESSRTLACKTPTQKAMRATVQTQPTLPYVSDERSCADVNRAIFRDVFQQMSETVRTRFELKGKPLFFVSDAVTSSERFWNEAALEIKQDESGTTLRSPAFVTVDNMNHFCKLLSPTKAAEWILIDGLR